MSFLLCVRTCVDRCNIIGMSGLTKRRQNVRKSAAIVAATNQARNCRSSFSSMAEVAETKLLI